MIGAASERLHKYKMDVLFVIYPSSESEQKSYQVGFFLLIRSLKISFGKIDISHLFG
jgi:hypothetical protein